MKFVLEYDEFEDQEEIRILINRHNMDSFIHNVTEYLFHLQKRSPIIEVETLMKKWCEFKQDVEL